LPPLSPLLLQATQPYSPAPRASRISLEVVPERGRIPDPHSFKWAAVDIFGPALANRIGKTSQLNRVVESSPNSDLPLSPKVMTSGSGAMLITCDIEFQA
jgi:hypothetical protein